MPTNPSPLLIIKEYLTASGVKHNETTAQTVPDYVTTAANLMGGRRHNDFDGKSEAGIEFFVFGGDDNAYLPISAPLMRFKCYGGTTSYLESERLARALSDRLNGVTNVTTTSGAIISALSIDAPQMFVDPDTEEICAVCSYQIHTRGND